MEILYQWYLRFIKTKLLPTLAVCKIKYLVTKSQFVYKDTFSYQYISTAKGYFYDGGVPYPNSYYREIGSHNKCIKGTLTQIWKLQYMLGFL